jgi:RNA polymerase sigma factor for flagellar operon FliA
MSARPACPPTAGATDRSVGRVETIEQYLPLVQHIVFQVAVHFPRHVEREELARAGALGLVEAAARYDADRGVPFERFAAQRIRGAILDAVRAADWAPRSVRSFARSVEETEQSLATQLGRRPTSDEVAGQLGVTTSELARLQERTYRSAVLALDHAVATDEDDELTLGDTLVNPGGAPDELLEHSELHGFLRDAVHLLPERHRMVIVGYFIDGRTSADLARFLGVTESRISQLRSEALDMLRHGIEAQFEPRADGPAGRAARRKADYAEAIAGQRGWRERIDAGAAVIATAV